MYKKSRGALKVKGMSLVRDVSSSIFFAVLLCRSPSSLSLYISLSFYLSLSSLSLYALQPPFNHCFAHLIKGWEGMTCEPCEIQIVGKGEVVGMNEWRGHIYGIQEVYEFWCCYIWISATKCVCVCCECTLKIHISFHSININIHIVSTNCTTIKPPLLKNCSYVGIDVVLGFINLSEYLI